MRDLSQRSQETELMDEEDISFEEFYDCLVGLERINHLTLAYRPTLQWLRPLLNTNERLYILDAATGGGDMLRQIAKRWPTRFTTADDCRMVGVDLNPWSKKSAELFSQSFALTSHAARPDAARPETSEESVPRSPAITYETENIFTFAPGQPVDIVISSLFTHHLTDAQVVNFLQWMDSRARRGWFINDLHRHPIPYYFIKGATALLSSNRLIRNDAAVSVARAFSIADWQRLIHEAGLDGRVRIQWFFPFRLCLSCNSTSYSEGSCTDTAIGDNVVVQR